MKVLVTGGAGFIGSNLVERLLEEGHDVRVLDNFSTGRRENLVHVADDVDIVEGDVQSYERAHRAVQGCEVVLHQAALPSVPRSIQDPLTTNATNIVGTLNVLLAARDSGIRRVVYASSSSVYGAGEQLPKTEEQTPDPMSPYAVGKLAGEGYCRSFFEVYGLETVALRYFNVFGPRQDPLSQYAAVIPRFITAFLADTPVTIYGDGEQSRDFTHVVNVVDANVLAMSTASVAGRTYNVACGERITINQLVESLREVTGREVQPNYAPARPGEVRHSHADIGRARRELGYEPRVLFQEALRTTVDVHSRNGEFATTAIAR
jgi:UDP-N-acetylglucosamine/UDP-N-acetyl-alpha-D-glucosaminouronate 4-epimerase